MVLLASTGLILFPIDSCAFVCRLITIRRKLEGLRTTRGALRVVMNLGTCGAAAVSGKLRCPLVAIPAGCLWLSVFWVLGPGCWSDGPGLQMTAELRLSRLSWKYSDVSGYCLIGTCVLGWAHLYAGELCASSRGGLTENLLGQYSPTGGPYPLDGRWFRGY